MCFACNMQIFKLTDYLGKFLDDLIDFLRFPENAGHAFPAFIWLPICFCMLRSSLSGIRWNTFSKFGRPGFKEELDEEIKRAIDESGKLRKRSISS